MRKYCIITILAGLIGYLTVGGAKATQQISNIISIQADPSMWFIHPITQQSKAHGVQVGWVTNKGDLTIETSDTTTIITLHRETTLHIPRSALLQPLEPITLTVPQTDTIEATIWAVDYLQGTCRNIPNQAVTRLLWLHCELAEETSHTLLDSITESDPVSVQAVGWWIQLQYGKDQIALQSLNERLEIRHQDEQDRIGLLSYRASLHASTFEYDLAILDLENALQKVVAIKDATLLRAKLHKQLGDTLLLLYEWDHVLEQYNTALDLAPSFADVYWARGMLYYTKGIHQSAQDDFKHYLLLEPTGYYSMTAQRAIEEIERLLGGL